MNRAAVFCDLEDMFTLSCLAKGYGEQFFEIEESPSLCAS